MVEFHVSKFGFKAHRHPVDSWVKSFQPAPLPRWDGLVREGDDLEHEIAGRVATTPPLH